MPAPTSGGFYTVPTGTEPADGPYGLDMLAEQVEDLALMHTAGSPKRVHVAVGLTGTTDASGYVTFNHGAPFTPRVCQVVIIRNAFSLGYVISTDTPTATQVVARFGSWSATTTLNSQALGAGAIAIISWE